MESNWIDLSSTLGLCAMIALTVNILLGMLLSTAYRRSMRWRRLPPVLKKISVDDLHNWTAYVALVLALCHPLLLLADRSIHFRIVDILFPLHAPQQRIWLVPGVLALYALIVVIITTQRAIRTRLSFRAWKNIHLISYGTALLFVVHGLAMDPELKDRPVDWLDGEKLLIEICGLIIVAATIARYKHYRKNKNKMA